MKRIIYLDNSATTRAYDDVIDYMGYVNKNVYGNPSSLHTKGMEAEKLIKKARRIMGQSLDVNPGNIYFTSGGTESNNLAILGYLRANPRKGKHIITTKIEHPSILEVFKLLQEEGYSTDYIDVDRNGIILLDKLREKIRDDTALISVMYVNNENGAIQPIEEINKIRNFSKKDMVFHVDAIQAYGKIEIRPKNLGINLLSISSHKIHGPKGIGALYVGEGIRLKPIILGGGQELSMRSGTENVPGICGFGLAADIKQKNISCNWEKAESLKKKLITLLEETFNRDEYDVLTPERSSPYILNVSFANIKAEVLLHHLAEEGIFVSTGSACSPRKNRHSHVLKAMGVSLQMIEGALRFSFSDKNSEGDIIETVEVLKEVLPKIRIR